MTIDVDALVQWIENNLEPVYNRDSGPPARYVDVVCYLWCWGWLDSDHLLLGALLLAGVMRLIPEGYEFTLVSSTWWLPWSFVKFFFRTLYYFRLYSRDLKFRFCNSIFSFDIRNYWSREQFLNRSFFKDIEAHLFDLSLSIFRVVCYYKNFDNFYRLYQPLFDAVK